MFRKLGVLRLFCFTAPLVVLAAWPLASARAQCSTVWDPVPTKGLKWIATIQGNVGALWGEHRNDDLNLGLLTAGFNVDVRGNLGPVVIGGAGTFQWGEGRRTFQIADLHVGLNWTRTGTSYYRYVLSQQSYIIGNYQLTHTRYCPQTQGTAMHHQLTTGPRFMFSWRGGGMGVHLTYRFIQFWTRARMGWWVDLQALYANINTFYNGSEFERGSLTNVHAYGGMASLNYWWTWFSSGMSLGYFAGAWQFYYTVGMTFWGA
jgi:hypothetical protein